MATRSKQLNALRQQVNAGMIKQVGHGFIIPDDFTELSSNDKDRLIFALGNAYQKVFKDNAVIVNYIRNLTCPVQDQ